MTKTAATIFLIAFVLGVVVLLAKYGWLLFNFLWNLA